MTSALFRLCMAVLLLIALASLSGCGFRPVYGGAASALSGAQVTAGGQDRISFLIQTSVEEQVGSGSSPYRLALTTNARERGLGRAGDGRATRFALTVTVGYTLRRTDGVDEAPIRGRVSERVVYEAPNDPFALLAARSSAEDRAAEVAGRAVVQALSLALREAREPGFAP